MKFDIFDARCFTATAHAACPWQVTSFAVFHLQANHQAKAVAERGEKCPPQSVVAKLEAFLFVLLLQFTSIDSTVHVSAISHHWRLMKAQAGRE
jgi:hypothetical protein